MRYNINRLTEETKCFLMDNYKSKTNRELAAALQIRKTKVRSLLKKTGLKKRVKQFFEHDTNLATI